MSQRIRRHLTPSTLIALLALVFATTGGAFAASGHGGGAGAKASAAITPTATVAKAKSKAKAPARGPAGPKGATGATGAAGPAGPAGPAGAQGAQGTAGTNGTNGEKGTPGTPGGEGPEGSEGPEGPAGSPWTAGGTLPAGQAETGTWSYAAAGGGVVTASISFPIQLKEPLDKETSPGSEVSTQVHVIWPGENAPAGCTNGSIADPIAEPGNLCIYSAHSKGTAGVGGLEPADDEQEKAGAGKTGTTLYGGATAGAYTSGVWIVRAPAES